MFNPFDERPIVAVTGSAGKTTTKAMTAAILRTKWIIFESKDYWNTSEHTEKHAEQLQFHHHAAVLEYGMAYPGVITRHCSIIQPNISIITNIGLAHVGNFSGKIEDLAAGKSELIKGMNQKGILLLNKDDENSKHLHTQNFKGTIITVGINQAADYQAHSVSYTKSGMSFQVKLDGVDETFTIPIFGPHNVYNALFALAVAHRLGFNPSDIRHGLSNFKKPDRRLDVFELRDGVTVIDDTVHAHPTAVKAALDVLCEVSPQKKIAVLGRMPELGELMVPMHHEVGRYLATKSIDLLFTYGNNADLFGEGAIQGGFPADKIIHYPNGTRDELHQAIAAQVEPGTTILVKGASRLNMNDTVRFLRDYFKEEKK
ncbi:UDP-N-acetylmuramoyl-tripeptide--D-alanyl-D-alanine ligase [Brevibacillus dissolubilis]|uniref:UDP-N-acetylmuramoyl-tripeptide--D-alanyl-D- alanine ligase n=1 Tax=Brevibacillus dissolubilis TaxID=1844116 RepID=UPI0021004DFA|nr:UDP-N-acetylmuramoyl-tripeptide--D-alanyl-D-alanine ligase [Brevibacillus dissolubilis]